MKVTFCHLTPVADGNSQIQVEIKRFLRKPVIVTYWGGGTVWFRLSDYKRAETIMEIILNEFWVKHRREL